LILPRDYRSMPVTKIVIASQAKQSNFAPDKKAGLLRLARNHGRVSMKVPGKHHAYQGF
jgi:hypothetical protein